MTDHLPPRVLFGAAYYLEYQRTPRLEEDLDRMVEAGFTLIRVGESVWSTWEPEDGVFDLDWLQPVLDGAHARGISVLLGTPTYAIPMWLARTYPELAAERSTGQRLGWGARQEVDFTHPAFRFHAERVVRQILARYADHPAVVGFQVDNEPGNELFFNHNVFQRFTDELRREHGTVENLNAAWGLAYWSHRLSTWADLWTPDNNAQPQYDLAWRRFQARQTTELIAWQAALVREYASPEQVVTTCLSYDRPALADDAVGGVLDITSGNPYYRMQHHMGLPDPAPVDTEQGWFTTGTWALYRMADRMWSTRQEPFLVTETNASSIWDSSLNETPFDGQLRQGAWALVARGARAVEYWHWNTLPYGAETYWGGVLPHTGQPGRTYRHVAQIGADLERAAGDVVGLVPEADLGLLYANDSKWAMAFQPPFGGIERDPRSYEKIVDAWYRAAFDARRQVRVLHPRHLFTQTPAEVAATLPALVVPGFYLATDEQLDWLGEYAAAGGHLVLGIRTGYADPQARAREERQPARLTGAAGVSYDEFSTVGSVPVRSSGEVPLAEDAAARSWVDGLVADEGTQVLATYDHPHFARWPTATTRVHGTGRVTVVGTHPDPDLGASLVRWVVPQGLADAWLEAGHDSVVVTGGVDPSGARGTVRYVHNYSWEPADVVVPVDSEDLLAERDAAGARPVLAAGSVLALGPWDVRVLRERG